MSVIFQLFGAEDLQKLSLDQLKELRGLITETLRENGLGKDENGSPAIPLKVSDDTQPPQGAPPQIIEALNQRFHEVSRQLKSPQLQSPFNFDTLIREHFNQIDDKEKEKERMILQWAVSCEVNNFKFYDRLLRARERAYVFFIHVTRGQRPKGPDSLYSPFYPEHPLYNFFYGLSNPEPNPPQGAADSSS
jgi:hypothetical protein